MNLSEIDVEEYRFGKIVINGSKYTNDVILFPGHVESDWWRKEGHSICEEDIKEVIDYEPEIFVLGTGKNGRVSVPDKFKKDLEGHGIDLRFGKTDQAIEMFKDLLEKGNDVVAGLHLTC